MRNGCSSVDFMDEGDVLKLVKMDNVFSIGKGDRWYHIWDLVDVSLI